MLTITTTHQPATDIGYLLAKHPDRVQTFEIPYGKAYVFYPEATPERCTMAMLTEIDPIAITRQRGRQGSGDSAIQQYVNDRPYAACSHLSVAIADVFRSALNGTCKEHPELVDTPMPLVTNIPCLPSRQGPQFIRNLFEPLGYEVQTETPPVDSLFPQWGESSHHDVTLSKTTTVQQLLNHLYVLIPVLDNSKHYWVGHDEAAKLIQRGEGWLNTHPMKEIIFRRYLRYNRSLMNRAHELISQIDQETVIAEEPATPEDAAEATIAGLNESANITESEIEKPIALSEARTTAVMATIRESSPQSVIDLGCGEGALLQHIVRESAITRIAATDVSPHALDLARRKVGINNMTNRQAERISIFQSSLIYDDPRTHDFDVAVLMEVIEHVDPPKLDALEYSVFDQAKPRKVVVTTPNVEYNQLFTNIRKSGLRHRDHRFEWTRKEFRKWASTVAHQHGYSVAIHGIGVEDTSIPAGHPTQMAVFTR